MPDLPSERYSDMYLMQGVYHTVSRQYYSQMLCASLKTKQIKKQAESQYTEHICMHMPGTLAFLTLKIPLSLWCGARKHGLFCSIHMCVVLMLLLLTQGIVSVFGLFVLAFFIPSPLSYTSHSASIPLPHTIIEEKKSFQVIIKIGCLLF